MDCEVCRTKLERIEQANMWNNMVSNQAPPKAKKDRFKSLQAKEIAKEVDNSELLEQTVVKDNESLWRSILTLAGLDQHLFTEMKLQLPEIVER